MGRDLLAQDYLLKQIAASLTNPDTGLGKKFWDGVYGKAYDMFGTTDIPTDVFNKVWITPDKAVIYEKGSAVYVLENHLKVMLESDYRAMQVNAELTPKAENDNEAVKISKEVMREVIIPAIEKEVNEGKNFAPLRQVYSGMLLATWYKRALKETILGKLYADKGKVKGVDQDPANNQKIYEEYVQAFKTGVFNMIKEDVDRYSQEIIPRKYFSGGTEGYTKTEIEKADMAQAQVDYANNAQNLDMAETRVTTTYQENNDQYLNNIVSKMGSDIGAVPRNAVQNLARKYQLTRDEIIDITEMFKSLKLSYNLAAKKVGQQDPNSPNLVELWSQDEKRLFISTVNDLKNKIAAYEVRLKGDLSKENMDRLMAGDAALANSFMPQYESSLDTKETVAVQNATANDIFYGDPNAVPVGSWDDGYLSAMTVDGYLQEMKVNSAADYEVFRFEVSGLLMTMMEGIKVRDTQMVAGVISKLHGLQEMKMNSPMNEGKIKNILKIAQRYVGRSPLMMAKFLQHIAKDNSQADVDNSERLITSRMIPSSAQIPTEKYVGTLASMVLDELNVKGVTTYAVQDVKGLRRAMAERALASLWIDAAQIDNAASMRDWNPTTAEQIKSDTLDRRAKTVIAVGGVIGGIVLMFGIAKGALNELARPYKAGSVEQELMVKRSLEAKKDNKGNFIMLNQYGDKVLVKAKDMPLDNSMTSIAVAAFLSILAMSSSALAENVNVYAPSVLPHTMNLRQSPEDFKVKNISNLIGQVLSVKSSMTRQMETWDKNVRELGAQDIGAWQELNKNGITVNQREYLMASTGQGFVIKVSGIDGEATMVAFVPVKSSPSYPGMFADAGNNKLASNDSGSFTKGGIDMNSNLLNMQIKRDGAGVPLPVSQQDLENIRIDGLVPVILDIKPAANVPLFS
jgi:hypothetical protein